MNSRDAMQEGEKKSDATAPDKRRYPYNIFLFSPLKDMVWYSLKASQ